ncbi:MAG TPA: sialidase family protein [Vicinamibacterales bacterium]|nr:sialidase family protein [Vicinamibacterales bacterium]
MRSTILATVALLGVAAAAQTPQPWTLKIQPLELASQRGSSGAQVSVSKRGVLLSWLETDNDEPALKFAERTATGWTPPVKVASGEDWFITEADTPSVLRLSNGTLVADWMQSSSDEFEASNLRLSYSKDNGKTWSKTFLPHHDGTITQHAFATLFELANGNLGVVWLDGRLTVKDREHGPMTLRYGAYNAQWAQVSDRGIDVKVCDCCTTSVAMTADGPIAVYRNRTDDEIRDIYVTRYENGAWTAGKTVHDDGWSIHACPVNGPSISANGRNVAVAWFVAKNDQGQAFAAFSNDAGRTWGQPIRLDDAASLGKVEIEMLDDGSAVAAWMEFANQRSQFRVRRIEASGAKSAPVTVAGAAGTGRAGGVPRMARSGSELVFAWVDTPENGGIGGVKTATAALPH